MLITNTQKIVWIDFPLRNIGDQHDLYVQSNQLILTEIFQNFRSKFTERYELDPADFLSETGIAWQVFLKKIGIELELVTDTDTLKMKKMVNNG